MNALPHALPVRAAAVASLLLLFAPEAEVLTPEGPRPRSSVTMVSEVDSPPPLQETAFDLDQGWISYTFWKNTSGVPLKTFTTTWRVPPPPATRHRQTIFLFNGLQNSGPNYGILQPVLQWGPSAAGGGDYWTVASWYVTSRGQAFHTPLQRVEPGQVLVGEMQLLGEERGKYHYTSEFLGIPRTRLLLKNVAELNWSTESMEAYNVRRCSDYPASKVLPFTAIRLVTDGHPALRWTAVDRVTDCDQHAEVVSHSSEDGQVDLQLGSR
jgi:hypothetical protein